MSGDFENKPTVRVSPTRQATPQENHHDPFSAETVRVGDLAKPVSPAQHTASIDDNATRLYRPGAAKPTIKAISSDDGSPVVAWLVVIKGPGQGCSLKLSYGLNAVGRGTEQRVRMDFGDDQISRTTHFSVAYDGRNRKFYLQHGGGQNLTYLNEAPVLAAVELVPMDEINVGNTVLRFVPFCGADFDWEDLKDEEQ